MADSKKAKDIQGKIRQSLEKLSELFENWLNQNRPARQLVPVPIDRPFRKR